MAPSSGFPHPSNTARRMMSTSGGGIPAAQQAAASSKTLHRNSSVKCWGFFITIGCSGVSRPVVHAGAVSHVRPRFLSRSDEIHTPSSPVATAPDGPGERLVGKRSYSNRAFGSVITAAANLCSSAS